MNSGNNAQKGRPPSIVQICLTVVFCLLFFIVLKIMGAPKQAETNILIEQFHLPKEIKFDRVRVNRKNNLVTPPTIEAYIEFSEPEFRAYQRGLNNPDLWQPQPIHYDGQVFNGPYAPDALSWDDSQAGNMMSWDAVSSKQAQDAKHAKTLCFAMRYPGGDGAAFAPYAATRCSENYQELESVIIVQGLLDEDNRTLHMLVRGVRPKR